MKTKSRLIPLALALILILALAACGASKSTTAEARNNVTEFVPQPSAAADTQSGLADSAATAEQGLATGSGDGTAAVSETTLPSSDKIIYSGYAQLETLNYDKTLADLQALIKNSGGFVQNSSETGGDYNALYNGDTVYRTANYTLRIPVDQFKPIFETGLKSLGNIVSSSSNADNITMQYADTDSRLKTYRTEEDRLLDMLSKSTTVEDMLAIESRLSDVRYNIESLTSQLKNWDSQVSYSTLSLSIQEVAVYAKDNSGTVSYGEQLKQTFSHALYSLGRFFKELLKFLVAALPTLVVLGILALIVLLIVRAVNKKKKARTPPAQNGGGNPPAQQ